MDKKFILMIIGIILMSIPFVILGLYNETSDDLPCYDNNQHIIQGMKCSGEENKIMDSSLPLILILTFIGVGLFFKGLIDTFEILPYKT